MAYQDVDFPTIGLIHGFRAVPYRDSVRILRNKTTEWRFKDSDFDPDLLIFPGRNITPARWSTIKTFIDSVDRKLDSFNLVRPDTGETTVVRFEQIPEIEIIALNSSNEPAMYFMSDISFVEVDEE